MTFFTVGLTRLTTQALGHNIRKPLSPSCDTRLTEQFSRPRAFGPRARKLPVEPGIALGRKWFSDVIPSGSSS